MRFRTTNRNKIKPKLSKHCLGTIVCGDSNKLFDSTGCAEALQVILKKYDVQCIGQQLYEFPNKSYTILVALAESHISIHTWPERLTVQLDVFLCNYMHENSKKCEDIYNDIVEYFDATEQNTTLIERL
jgi:S-adenosylmethionine decarboxylase